MMGNKDNDVKGDAIDVTQDTMRGVILEKLDLAFSPDHLEVINRSHLHKGHAGDDGSGQTHYHIVISSSQFENKNRIEQHRMINNSLEEEMGENGSIHALSIKVVNK